MGLTFMARGMIAWRRSVMKRLVPQAFFALRGMHHILAWGLVRFWERLGQQPPGMNGGATFCLCWGRRATKLTLLARFPSNTGPSKTELSLESSGLLSGEMLPSVSLLEILDSCSFEALLSCPRNIRRTGVPLSALISVRLPFHFLNSPGSPRWVDELGRELGPC